MSEIVVVGGGISGLATAWFLRERGHRVRVLEASPAPGGCLRTLQVDGYLIEVGPNSTLSKGGAFDELVHGVGMAAEQIEGNRLAKRRYVVKDGAPVALPGSPSDFLSTPLFSARAKLRLLAEPFRRRAANEESVADFVRRRLGQEFLDWAIDPFVSGVYAGDPNRLSARAATAKVYALEAEHGSLIVGAIARALRGKAAGPQPVGRLVSFRSGIGALPAAIARALGGSIGCGAPVEALRRVGDAWEVHAGGETCRAERVVISVGARETAKLVADLSPEAAAELDAIAYPPVMSIALGFPRAAVRHPLDGFGVLIPSRESRQTLGALFSSTLFPGRAPDDRVLLTAFIGGARNVAVAGRNDASLVAQVLQDLRPLLGISGDPVLSRVSRWDRAIPQYELGHLQRLARIDEALRPWPGLHLRANWRDGISVSDCVTNARAMADRLSAH